MLNTLEEVNKRIEIITNLLPTFETITADVHGLLTSTEATKYPSGTIFDFPAGINKVRVYVWLEGQDIDNEDTASLGTGVGVKLNFKLADTTS